MSRTSPSRFASHLSSVFNMFAPLLVDKALKRAKLAPQTTGCRAQTMNALNFTSPDLRFGRRDSRDGLAERCGNDLPRRVIGPRLWERQRHR